MGINAMGFGLIVPVVPKLVMELSGQSIASATAIGGQLAFTFAIFQFIFSPIVGNLSDRFGRRPVLLGSLAGFAVDFILLAFAPTLFWVFIARAVSGMFGATNGPAQSVIADLIPPNDRARYFGLIGAAFSIGFVIGPFLGGVLGYFGYKVPFLVAGALAFANFIYGWFALPETLAPENRRPFEWRRANPVGNLLHVRTLPGIIPISIIYFLWQVASLIYPMTWTYYAMGRYGWSELLIGVSLGLVGISLAVAQIRLLPWSIARFGGRKSAIIGMTFAVIALIGYAIFNVAWAVFILIPIMAVQALVHPNLTAMMTRRASASTQGEVQGFASGVMALGSLVAPLLYNPLLAWLTGGAPKGVWAQILGPPPFIFWGAAFVAAALCAAIGLAILMRLPPSMEGTETA
jgi:MFS transporter, DHA1 family, tetracycline resistance protein